MQDIDTITFTISTTRNSIDSTVVKNQVTADFNTVENTISALVARIEFKTRHLACYGNGVKGVTVTDAKNTAREIRGMISAVECICDSRTLSSELLDNLATARAKALDRLRK